MKRFFIIHNDGDEFADILPQGDNRDAAEAATVHAWQRLTLHEQRRAEFFGLIEAEPDDPDEPGTPGRWNACPNYDTADDVRIIKTGRRSAPTAIFFNGSRYLFGLDAIAADQIPAEDADPLPF